MNKQGSIFLNDESKPVTYNSGVILGISKYFLRQIPNPKVSHLCAYVIYSVKVNISDINILIVTKKLFNLKRAAQFKCAISLTYSNSPRT